jgi:tetratricopeptide (TPR) repeat protein
MWQLGEVERARQLIDEANRRANDLGHAPSMAHPLNWRSRLEILRGDAAAALSAAETLEGLCRQHGMPYWRAKAELDVEWARSRLHPPAAGPDGLRRALGAAAHQGMLSDAWFYTALLAELEGRMLGAESALERIEEALVLARRVDDRCDLRFPYLLRGELLLARDPSNPVPAEEAFGTARAIAREQGARSWGLRAALALSKLYQSTGRSADAHDVLGPALEGFAPTPEMPEIAEAQALLTALAATDEVKVEAAHRQRLTQLHVSYGNALIAARGYGARETTEAFARARESTAGDKDAPDRLSADYGLWVGSFVRGELPSMRAHATAFLSDLEATPDSPEASVARRISGVTCWCAGEYPQARDYFEKALALFQPGRDDDMAFRFGQDPGVVAMTFLAFASWPLARSIGRFRLSTVWRRGWRTALMSARSRLEECRRPCSN